LLGALGSRLTQAFHGRRRSEQGFLLLKRSYVLPDQERALGWCYVGLFGFVLFAIAMFYMATKYGVTTRPRRVVLGHWGKLPLDVKIAVLTMFPGFVIGWISAWRLGILSQEIAQQPLSDLEWSSAELPHQPHAPPARVRVLGHERDLG
jgi:hypothetical protein